MVRHGISAAHSDSSEEDLQRYKDRAERLIDAADEGAMLAKQGKKRLERKRAEKKAKEKRETLKHRGEDTRKDREKAAVDMKVHHPQQLHHSIVQAPHPTGHDNHVDDRFHAVPGVPHGSESLPHLLQHGQASGHETHDNHRAAGPGHSVLLAKASTLLLIQRQATASSNTQEITASLLHLTSPLSGNLYLTRWRADL